MTNIYPYNRNHSYSVRNFMRKSINSLERGLDILSSFNSQNDAFSAQTLSEQLNIPLSTTYRYLETLKKKSFLVKNQVTKMYELGFVLLVLGNVASSRMKLGEVLLPHLKSLSSSSGETVLLTAVRGWEVVCIERVETQRLIKLTLEKGSTLPLHAGASSKILLAYQENRFLDSLFKRSVLIKYTKSTITNPVQLKKELKKIRKQGYAFSDQEVDFGAVGIGAPVFDHKGKVVAGITVAGPRERMNKKISQLIEMLKMYGEKASREMGYRPSKL